ncbi:MAG TPA: CRISPR-associated helicase Cas3' [Hymenobacter sp.]|uniref:CRISPR-associated helicase Cas3' n=1 Tax=Hymenobacter sp. TaxID=1898978 RepID=UPI002D7FA76D|nr:CRISPR-associated helicase Cas3' [Hymenobacter sp.]HET9505440.1 CRISPR-associated helicase Cas3' [Hymenobacter sp.]
MSTAPELLAKSASHGGELSLLAHTQHVVAAAEAVARATGFEVRLARLGAALHDLGKAHPAFQRKLRLKPGGADPNPITHRHELSSLGFLPLVPRADWPAVIDMVVAHHKPIQQKDDLLAKGILDLDDRSRTWQADHLAGWEDWSPGALAVLAALDLGMEVRPVSRAEAAEALQAAVAHCGAKRKNWSPWRGLLQAADHFASALQHDTAGQLPTLFAKPDLRYFNRSAALYPLSLLAADQPQAHTLVVAPTGAGKTDYLLRRCRGRVFYTLPFQASINSMFERMRKADKEKPFGGSIRLQHAASQLVENRGPVEKQLQALVGASAKVLTPHQLAAVVFGTPGYEAVMLDVRGADIILDEVHTYAAQAQSMVLEIVDALRRLGCRLHIGTATMPTVLYQELLHRLGGPAAVAEVALSAAELDAFDRHAVYKIPRDADNPKAWPTAADDILAKALAAQEKVLVICNTVQGAQERYKELRAQFPEVRMLLLHSRFKRGDRAERERRLEDDFNSPTVPGPCLVVSTQVVEVSLDISFDRMLTEAAPLDALVQRFGRVNRRRTPDTIGKLKPVHVLAPGPSCLPYSREVIEASFAQLPDEGEVLRERDAQTKIDAVYPTLPTWDISTHVIWDGERCKLRELCNNQRAVLVETLEIESTACILAADRTAYLEGRWEARTQLEISASGGSNSQQLTQRDARTQLEIPVSWRSMYARKKTYERLDVGSMPFVVPGNKDYDELGLQFEEYDIFLEN